MPGNLHYKKEKLKSMAATVEEYINIMSYNDKLKKKKGQ